MYMLQSKQSVFDTVKLYRAVLDVVWHHFTCCFFCIEVHSLFSQYISLDCTINVHLRSIAYLQRAASGLMPLSSRVPVWRVRMMFSNVWAEYTGCNQFVR